MALIGMDRDAQAKIVQWNGVPCLIATFKRSLPSLVWQMEMAKLLNYSLKLVQNEGEWDLGYVGSSDAAFVVIAHFEERPDAEKAYHVLQKALFSAGNVSGKGSKTGWFGRLLMLLGIVFLLMLAFDMLIGGGAHEPQPGGSAAPAAASQSSSVPAQPKEIQPGVPMNADEILPWQAD